MIGCVYIIRGPAYRITFRLRITLIYMPIFEVTNDFIPEILIYIIIKQIYLFKI